MEVKNPGDEELIRLFIDNNDYDAFTQLVERHKVMIRKIIFTVLCSAQHSYIEDIEQEILISIFHGLKNFRFRSSFSTWLYRICRNKAVDFYKRENREQLKKDTFNIVKNNSDPEDLFLRNEKKEELFKALSTLKEKERMLILLKDIEQLPLNEVSKIMRLPIGTVKSRLHRSREKLSLILGGKI